MAQLSLFDFPKFKITKKIRLIELFGGIGSQAMALRDIGADFEHYKLVEFDKYAVASYNAIHDTRHTTHDIRQIHASDLEIVDKDKYCYLMTYSFPCTDLSVAGKMQGMSKKDWEEGNSTRSGLLWEVERILKECKQEELPDVLLMENVPQVHAEANRADFDNWLNFLKSKGYWNFWKDLNAKDFGIPQNRDRCFCVSILSKDFVDFEFPEPVKLEKVMKDYLEDSVDEKYYINNEKAKKLIAELIESGVLPTDNRQQTTDRVPNNGNCVNNRNGERQSEIRSEIGNNGLCINSACERLQGTGEFCKNEWNNSKVQSCVSMNLKKIEKTEMKIAKTLCARDCKGYTTGFQFMNGVIEKWK